MMHFLNRYKAYYLIPIFYLALSKLAHTLLLTIVTSVVLMTGQSGQELSNSVNEISSQYVLTSYALAALLTAITVWLGDKALYSHSYFWAEERKKPWQLERSCRQEFYRGLSSGALAAMVVCIILLSTGQISYLGIYITSTFGSPVFPIFVTNFLSIILLLICDEFIFRHKLLQMFFRVWPEPVAIFASTLLYLLLKWVQFPLQTMDLVNLSLLGLILGFFYAKNKKSHRGLGFVLSLICLLHPMAGLPLWSQTSPSFFLLKHSAKSSEWMTGGPAGPMASIAIFSMFLLFSVASVKRWQQSGNV